MDRGRLGDLGERPVTVIFRLGQECTGSTGRRHPLDAPGQHGFDRRRDAHKGMMPRAWSGGCPHVARVVGGIPQCYQPNPLGDLPAARDERRRTCRRGKLSNICSYGSRRPSDLGEARGPVIDRFAVRKTERGYGVWDAGTSGWRSRQDLSLDDAEGQAATMNGQERAAKSPPTGQGLRQNPPKPCQVYLDGDWWTGYLTEWQQDQRGGWWGSGTCDDRPWRGWIPAAHLRPLT